MKVLHILLKYVVESGIQKQIDICNVGNISTDDMYLKIFSDEKLPTAHPPMGKFVLSEIIGYWIEEKENKI